MPHPNPVVHFEILGRNQKPLEAFYKSVFNWEITPLEDGSMIKADLFSCEKGLKSSAVGTTSVIPSQLIQQLNQLVH